MFARTLASLSHFSPKAGATLDAPPSGPSPAFVFRSLAHAIDVAPIGWVIADGSGRALWYNQEAKTACDVWNRRPAGGNGLPLHSHEFTLPPVLGECCRALHRAWVEEGREPASRDVAAPDLGLYAQVTLRRLEAEACCWLMLDYRRKRGDRERAVSPEALRILSLLTFAEREVALRVRDGLTNYGVGQALSISPLTVKTHLSTIYRKVGVKTRSQLASLLNRPPA